MKKWIIVSSSGPRNPFSFAFFAQCAPRIDINLLDNTESGDENDPAFFQHNFSLGRDIRGAFRVDVASIHEQYRRWHWQKIYRASVHWLPQWLRQPAWIHARTGGAAGRFAFPVLAFRDILTANWGAGPERATDERSYLALQQDTQREREWGAQTIDAYSKIA